MVSKRRQRVERNRMTNPIMMPLMPALPEPGHLDLPNPVLLPRRSGCKCRCHDSGGSQLTHVTPCCVPDDQCPMCHGTCEVFVPDRTGDGGAKKPCPHCGGYGVVVPLTKVEG